MIGFQNGPKGFDLVCPKNMNFQRYERKFPLENTTHRSGSQTPLYSVSDSDSDDDFSDAQRINQYVEIEPKTNEVKDNPFTDQWDSVARESKDFKDSIHRYVPRLRFL